jgi:hypothetical protein
MVAIWGTYCRWWWAWWCLDGEPLANVNAASWGWDLAWWWALTRRSLVTSSATFASVRLRPRCCCWLHGVVGALLGGTERRGWLLWFGVDEPTGVLPAGELAADEHDEAGSCAFGPMMAIFCVDP